MDIIDRILLAGSMLNPFSPLTTLIKDATNGPGHYFYIDAYAGHSVNDVRNTLSRAGFTVWGCKFMDDYITATVSDYQAEAAKTVLTNAGIKILQG